VDMGRVLEQRAFWVYSLNSTGMYENISSTVTVPCYSHQGRGLGMRIAEHGPISRHVWEWDYSEVRDP